MTRILAVASNKGGTGKTSLVQNLGAELARLGQRVLLVDLDPQSNLTSGWGVASTHLESTIYHALLEPKSSAQSIRAVRPNLDLLPATLDLAGAELAFQGHKTRATRLQQALKGLSHRYDLILVDTPPSLGFFTVNALAAATEVLIPLQAQVYAYRALDQLLPILDEVRAINPRLARRHIVLTMYDPRNVLTQTVEDMARQRFGAEVLRTVIPVNVRIAEAPLEGVSVGEYERSSKGALAYQMLARELLEAAG